MIRGPALELREIDLSLVVATLGEPALVSCLLESIAARDRLPLIEVVLVDQSGTDALVPVVETFAGRVLVIHERVGLRGASRARNLGADLARGTWLGFPDDDCTYLAEVFGPLATLTSDPDVAVITGRTVDESAVPNLVHWAGERCEVTRWNMFRCFTEATLFVRKERFLAAGGFDERFGPGAPFPAAEGIDLMNRLLAVVPPGAAVYDPAIVLQHPTKIPPWNRWATRRYYDYAIGAGAAVAKVPQVHMLYWAARTLLSSFRAITVMPGWRSAAYLARAAGLLKGIRAFHNREPR